MTWNGFVVSSMQIAGVEKNTSLSLMNVSSCSFFQSKGTPFLVWSWRGQARVEKLGWTFNRSCKTQWMIEPLLLIWVVSSHIWLWVWWGPCVLLCSWLLDLNIPPPSNQRCIWSIWDGGPPLASYWVLAWSASGILPWFWWIPRHCPCRWWAILLWSYLQRQSPWKLGRSVASYIVQRTWPEVHKYCKVWWMQLSICLLLWLRCCYTPTKCPFWRLLSVCWWGSKWEGEDRHSWQYVHWGIGSPGKGKVLLPSSEQRRRERPEVTGIYGACQIWGIHQWTLDKHSSTLGSVGMLWPLWGWRCLWGLWCGHRVIEEGVSLLWVHQIPWHTGHTEGSFCSTFSAAWARAVERVSFPICGWLLLWYKMTTSFFLAFIFLYCLLTHPWPSLVQLCFSQTITSTLYGNPFSSVTTFCCSHAIDKHFPPKTMTYCLVSWSNYSSFHVIPWPTIWWSVCVILYHKYCVVCTCILKLELCYSGQSSSTLLDFVLSFISG